MAQPQEQTVQQVPADKLFSAIEKQLISEVEAARTTINFQQKVLIGKNMT